MAKSKETKEKFYCVKCKEHIEELIIETVTTKNNRTMAKSKCSNCSTTVCKFLKNK